MSIVVRTCLIAFPQIMLLSTAVAALPVEVGRDADVYANAIAFQNAKPVTEVAREAAVIPEVVAIAPIVSPTADQSAAIVTEVVSDAVERGTPVLAQASVEDIAPEIVTEAATTPTLEILVADASSTRPRARVGVLPNQLVEQGYVAAAFDVEADVYFLPDPPVAAAKNVHEADIDGEPVAFVAADAVAETEEVIVAEVEVVVAEVEQEVATEIEQEIVAEVEAVVVETAPETVSEAVAANDTTPQIEPEAIIEIAEVADSEVDTVTEIDTVTADITPAEIDVDGIGDLLTAMADANPELSIRQGENGEEDTMVMLSEVLFQFGEADLAPEAEQTLSIIATTLEDVNQVIVTGHTDSIGSEENNLKLGQARAEAVRDWLLQHSDLSSDVVLAKGVGEADPIAPNVTDNGEDNSEGRAQNRRVEFSIN